MIFSRFFLIREIRENILSYRITPQSLRLHASIDIPTWSTCLMGGRNAINNSLIPGIGDDLASSDAAMAIWWKAQR